MFGYNTGVGMMLSAPVAVKTISLLHMDGANAGILFPDSVPSITWTPSSITTSTVQKEFGTASALMGATPTLTSGQNISLSGDFTIEMFVYPTANNYDLFNTNNTLDLTQQTTKMILYYNSSGAASATFANGIPSANTWTHVALVKTGTKTFKLFIGGNQVGTDVTGTADFVDANSTMIIGGTAEVGYYAGYIDEFRISNVARYTINFTPPSAPFVVD